MDEKVLIVGAGPTGLVLALWLNKLGIPVRIIDKDSGPGQTSRAMVVHARILEFYQQLNIAAEIVSKGIIVDNITLRKNGNVVASVELDLIGKNLSPFPFILSFPQDDHEKLLIEHLNKAGVHIERNTELVSFSEENDSVIATVKKEDKIETIKTSFLCGCDGASSVVRKQSGIEFKGGTYSQQFYVADIMATGSVVNGNLQLCLNDAEFTLVFPIRSSGSVRLIGVVPKEIKNKKIDFADISSDVIADTQVAISKLNWFSTYHSHHRIAAHFKKGRVFLLGDAGHIHSPVGGQGMNTGIGDAVNLGWKIAAVLHGRAASSILESFEPERIRFAQRLVSTTDKIFQAVINEGLFGRFVRNIFFPVVFPLVTRFKKVRQFLFSTVSQIKINYRHSPLSEGSVGKIKGGDRLPWVKYNDFDNFKSLELLDWQIHVYGEVSIDFKKAMEANRLHLNEFSWNKMAKNAGLEKNAVYLLRPDGYIALAITSQDAGKITEYLKRSRVLLI